MTRKSSFSVGFYLTLVFISGLLAGALGMRLYIVNSVSARAAIPRPTAEEVRRSYMDEMDRHLHLRADQISLVIPHQANLRIIEAVAQYLKIPMDRFVVNVDRYGNTSAASVPLALDEARKAGRIKAGDITLLVAFGAGLTYGSALIRW